MISLGSSGLARTGLEALEGAPFVFQLTGSRFFNDPNLDSRSDWDFYVQESPGVEEWLQNHGFDLVPPRRSIFNSERVTGYDDMNVSQVWTDFGVHVQVVADAALKTKAQRILADNPLYYQLSKVDRKYAWNLVYSTLRSK